MKLAEQPYLTADLIAVSVARHYEPEYGPSMVAIGLCSKWDLRFEDKTTMEVKVDRKAAETGNAAIEFWDTRRNIATGILATEAHLWLHGVPENGKIRFFEIDRKRLLRLCLESGDVKQCGEGKSSLIKLIPLEEIRRIANKEFILNGETHNTEA